MVYLLIILFCVKWLEPACTWIRFNKFCGKVLEPGKEHRQCDFSIRDFRMPCGWVDINQKQCEVRSLRSLQRVEMGLSWTRFEWAHWMDFK